MRDPLRSPVRENRTQGSARGAPGNRRPYLNKILVARRQPEDALTHQIEQRMLHKERIAPVIETIRKALAEAELAVQLADEADPRVAAEHSAVEIRHDFARSKALKLELLLNTLCHCSGVVVRIVTLSL